MAAAASLYPLEWLGKSRASLPKVKTGCATCKQRHVKCDETKPICNRCQKSSRACAYSRQQNQTISKDTMLWIQLGNASLQPPPNILRFSSEGEKLAFTSFQQKPAVELGRGLGWQNWGNIVLQSSDSDAALRHAVVALGAIHEATMKLIGASSYAAHQDFLSLAFHHYQKAIRTLRDDLGQNNTGSIEAKLLACMLLVVFDFIQGDDRAASAHLFGGAALLRSYLERYEMSEPLVNRISELWRTNLDRSGALPSEGSFAARLLLSYGYLDFWAYCWVDNHPILPEVRVLEGIPVARQPQPDTLLGISFQYFGPLEMRIREFLRAAKHKSTSQRSAVSFQDMRLSLISALALWHKGFEISCQAYTCTQIWEPTMVKTVTVNYKKLKLMLLGCIEVGVESYESLTPLFEEILELSRDLLRDEIHLSAAPFQPNSPFAFHWGVIHPLYITAIRCRDRTACKQAISLLETKRWREGAWDSFVMAGVARRKLLETRCDLSLI